jgi:hypothetical protein
MFVCLGTGNHQIPLLIALKHLNIPIIGIDKNYDAPGKIYCEHFFVSSIFDLNQLSKILHPFRNQILGIYSRSYGKAILVANQLAKEFNLPHNPEKTLLLFQNKENILKIALNHPDLKFQKDNFFNLEKFNQWIIKKKYSSSKRNIYFENDFKKVQIYLNNQEYIVEPYYEGKEYIFFGFVLDNQLYPLLITQKSTITEKKELLFCDKRHYYPNDLGVDNKYKIFQICNYLIKKTQLLIGPFLAEFIIYKNHPIFIEAVPEVGGEFICDILIPEITGIPYFELLAKIYLGKDYQNIKQYLYNKLLTPKNKSMLIEYIFQKEGTFIDILFPDSLTKSSFYYVHKILKTKYSYTSYENKNLDRIGMFALEGRTPIENLFQEAEKINKEIKIIYK